MNSLRSWIRTRHLEAQRLREYRAQFNSRKGPYIVLEDFLPDPLARDISRFLVEEAAYRPCFGLLGGSGECTEAEFLAAEEEKQFFRFQVLEEKQWGGELSAPAQSYAGLRKAFGERGFAAYAAALTGLTLGLDTEVGTHCLRSGDYLKTHRDLGRRRRIAFLLYLSPGWRKEFGGTLHLIDPDQAETCIVPKYNHLLLFDTVANQGHYVAPVESAAGDSIRVSIGGWLHDARG